MVATVFETNREIYTLSVLKSDFVKINVKQKLAIYAICLNAFYKIRNGAWFYNLISSN